MIAGHQLPFFILIICTISIFDVVVTLVVRDKRSVRILHPDTERKPAAVVIAASKSLVDQEATRFLDVILKDDPGAMDDGIRGAGGNLVLYSNGSAVDLDSVESRINADLLDVIVHRVRNVAECRILAGFQVEDVPILIFTNGQRHRCDVGIVERNRGCGVLIDDRHGSIGIIEDHTRNERFKYAVNLDEGLIGELHIGVVGLHGTRQLLLHNELSLLNGRHVEAQLQVGGTGAVLHKEHLEVMGAEVLEGIASEIVVNLAFIPGGAIRENTRQLEALLDGVVCVCTVFDHASTGDLTGREVDLTVECIMDAAQIQQQHAVHEDPEVVVADEFVEHGLSIHQAPGRHHEVVLHGHAKEVIDRLATRPSTSTDLIQGKVRLWIIRGKQCTVAAVRDRIRMGELGIQVIEGQELSAGIHI